MTLLLINMSKIIIMIITIIVAYEVARTTVDTERAAATLPR